MNNDLNQLPTPPQGVTGISPDRFSHLPPPPKGVQGMTLEQIKSQPQPQSQGMPLLTNQSTSFGQNLGTGLKDVAIGAGKGFIQGARGLAGNLQSAGKGVMGMFGADTSKLGFQSLDNSTPAGQQVNQQLQSKSRGEQVGKFLETVGELGTGFAAEEPQQLVSKAKAGYEAFTEARGAKLAEKEAQDALETVRPKLTSTEEADAKAAGRGQTSGLMKKTTIAPSTREVEMGKVAHEAGVSSSNAFDKNIQLMKDAQKTSADAVRTGLQKAQGTWTRNDVVHELNKIKTPLTIKSEPTLTRLANNFKKAITGLASGTNKNPEGLLDLRQGVDKIIEKEFPSNIYHKDTPVGQFVRQVRSALNDMTEAKLPEGKLPNGSTFKQELRRQSLLYEAIDNVASKAPKAGESARPILQKARDFAVKHPVYTTLGTLGAEKVLKNTGLPGTGLLP